MHTLVVGGTGFLGLHIVDELSKRGHQVSVLCRSPEKAKEIIPDTINLLQGDLEQLNTEDWEKLLQPFDGLVFAAGVDERAKPKGDAFKFFHDANVAPLERLLMAARKTNISHVVLLNSIFSFIDRKYPELNLTQHHPYIASRVEQSQMAHRVAKGHFIVTVLEVPWVFGRSHREIPMWSTLVNYVRGAVPILVTGGGANMISVTSVAQAVYGGLTYPKSSTTLPIGDTNMTWKELLEKMCDCTRRKDKNINIVSDSMFRQLTKTGHMLQDLMGEQSGLDTAELPRLVLTEGFYDPTESQQLLQYETGHLDAAIQQTVDAVPENQYLRNWRKYINLFVNPNTFKNPTKKNNKTDT